MYTEIIGKKKKKRKDNPSRADLLVYKNFYEAKGKK